MLLHKFFKTKDAKQLLYNFLSLSALKGVNYVLPLLTIPYLVRVIGVKYFGLLAFATAMIAYFNIIVDYGFSLTATREISIHRDNKEKVVEIFSSVMTIKTILTFFSFIVLIVIVCSFKKLSQYCIVYFLTFGTVVGQMLFPVWFFQGMEKMKYITYLNIAAKIIFTISIFIFVKCKSDFYLVPLFTSLGYIVAGVLSMYLIRKKFKVCFKFQNINNIKYYLKDGWHVFLSQINISLFSNSNIIILGFLANNVAVGYYSSAEKIMRAIAMMQTPITETLFPYIAKTMNVDRNMAMKKLKKILKVGGILYLVIVVTVAFYAKDIVYILYGSRLKNSVLVLQIISLIPLTIFLNNIFGTQIMLNTSREKQFSRILLWGALINILLCSILTQYLSYIGTAISLLIVEMYIMVAMYVSVRDELCNV